MNVYENKTGFIMAMFNDSIVLFLSYFPLLFTDFIPDLETRYFAGWIYIAIVALMVIGNLGVVLRGTVLEIIEQARRRVVELHNYRLLKIRKIQMNVRL